MSIITGSIRAINIKTGTIVSDQARIKCLEEQNDLLTKKVADLEAQAFERDKEHARNLKKALSYGR